MEFIKEWQIFCFSSFFLSFSSASFYSYVSYPGAINFRDIKIEMNFFSQEEWKSKALYQQMYFPFLWIVLSIFTMDVCMYSVYQCIISPSMNLTLANVRWINSTTADSEHIMNKKEFKFSRRFPNTPKYQLSKLLFILLGTFLL